MKGITRVVEDLQLAPPPHGDRLDGVLVLEVAQPLGERERLLREQPQVAVLAGDPPPGVVERGVPVVDLAVLVIKDNAVNAGGEPEEIKI